MNDDPYTTLGVTKSATGDEIRKAYRKLAKQLHPDLNPGDTEAEERFKAVAGAYQLLSDEEKRARFDKGEIDASGNERAPQYDFYRQYADADQGYRYARSSGYDDFTEGEDIFADLFGRGQGGGGGRGGQRFKMRGQSVRYHLEVDFVDAAKGATRRVTMPDGNALDITIPAGIADGGTLRLKGKGGPGINGGPPGDALIEISVTPHKVFARDGDDIVVELPITIDEAIIGGKVEVPTIGGTVKMSVPKRSSSGDVLRLRGRGIHAKGKTPGNQRVVLKIVMPETVDPELESFMETWRESHAYNPRAKLKVSS
ncbi:DnaJ C-terminal domain-containing protein [Acuticoccus kandeliae]|uniref:DnaJ C-terminal domain-containing protein n=1 Tax=Acuticoccus kandeliae TaxID=2073160 RepID=UPI000D3EDDBF|nr:DnaJ C-terminal domain-containing protein [Acuticoccus kandeliae]